jgi:hypothetical protein
MRILKRILLAVALSWIYSVTLGWVFACALAGNFSLNTLRLPGVIPVALIGSTLAAIAITPLAAWSVRTGVRNLWIYGPIFWLILAGYIVLVIPKTGIRGPYGLFGIAVIGVLVLGLIPPPKELL